MKILKITVEIVEVEDGSKKSFVNYAVRYHYENGTSEVRGNVKEGELIEVFPLNDDDSHLELHSKDADL